MICLASSLAVATPGSLLPNGLLQMRCSRSVLLSTHRHGCIPSLGSVVAVRNRGYGSAKPCRRRSWRRACRCLSRARICREGAEFHVPHPDAQSLSRVVRGRSKSLAGRSLVSEMRPRIRPGAALGRMMRTFAVSRLIRRARPIRPGAVGFATPRAATGRGGAAQPRQTIAGPLTS